MTFTPARSAGTTEPSTAHEAGAVVFWKKDNDLTQKVLELLNKENAAGNVAAPVKK